MASRERHDQLLATIDAVLSECTKDPRRRSPSRPARPAWPGPSWLNEGALEVSAFQAVERGAT